MREPSHAASVVRAMADAVKIPVTVKMRAGWNDKEINAPTLAKMVEDAGAAAVTVHGRTAAQSYTGQADWDLVGRIAEAVKIPVIGSGDCVEPGQILDRLSDGRVSGVLVGRGALRNPWIFAQASAAMKGQQHSDISMADRGQFLLEYIDLLLAEGVDEADGFRHAAPGQGSNAPAAPARGRERWVINKLRALCAWYTKGLIGGSDLRVKVNHTDSIAQLRETIDNFFVAQLTTNS